MKYNHCKRGADYDECGFDQKSNKCTRCGKGCGVSDFITNNDQSNKADNGKINTELLYVDMALALTLVNRVLDYGSEKYEKRGWRKVEPARYKAALLRHVMGREVEEQLTGITSDQETYLLEWAHIATNALFMLQMEIESILDSSPERSCTWRELCKYMPPPQDHKKEKK